MDIQKRYSEVSADYEKYTSGSKNPIEKQRLENKIKDLTKKITESRENFSQYKDYATKLFTMLESFSKEDSEILESRLAHIELPTEHTPEASAVTKSIQVSHDVLLEDILKYKTEKLQRLKKGDETDVRSREKNSGLLIERVAQLRDEILAAPTGEVPESIIFSFNNLIGKEFNFEKITLPRESERTVSTLVKKVLSDTTAGSAAESASSSDTESLSSTGTSASLRSRASSMSEEIARAATDVKLVQFHQLAAKALGPFYDETNMTHAYEAMKRFSPNAIDYTEFFEKSMVSALATPLAALWEKSSEVQRKNLSALLADSLLLTCFHPQPKQSVNDMVYADLVQASPIPNGLTVFTFQEFVDLVKKMTPVGAPIRGLFVEWSDYTKLTMSQKIFTLLTAKMNSKALVSPKTFKENYQQLLQSSQLPMILFGVASFMTPEVFLNMGLAGVLNQELFSRFQSLPALFDLAGGMIAQIREDSSKLDADTTFIKKEVDEVEAELGKITKGLLEKAEKGSLKEAELTSFLTSMNRCLQRLTAISSVENPFYASPKLLTGHTTASKLLATAGSFFGRKTADSTPLTEIPHLKLIQESYFFEGAFFPATIDLSAKKQSSEEITQLWNSLLETGGHAVKVRDGLTVHVRASLEAAEKVFLVMDPNGNQFKTYNLDAFKTYLNR